MKLFSILQQAIHLVHPTPDGDKEAWILFSEDPNDSALVRLRTESSESDMALELTFNRNGIEVSRRLWPRKYPAWDGRAPDVIEKEIAASEAEAVEARAEMQPAAHALGAKRGRLSKG